MLWLTPAPAWNGSTRKLSISVACELASLGRAALGGQAQDLVGGADDGAGQLVRQASGGVVGACRGLLDLDRGAHQRRVGPAAADREVADGARGLDAVVGVGRHLELAQRVALDPNRQGAVVWRVAWRSVDPAAVFLDDVGLHPQSLRRKERGAPRGTPRSLYGRMGYGLTPMASASWPGLAFRYMRSRPVCDGDAAAPPGTAWTVRVVPVKFTGTTADWTPDASYLGVSAV